MRGDREGRREQSGSGHPSGQHPSPSLLPHPQCSQRPRSWVPGSVLGFVLVSTFPADVGACGTVVPASATRSRPTWARVCLQGPGPPVTAGPRGVSPCLHPTPASIQASDSPLPTRPEPTCWGWRRQGGLVPSAWEVALTHATPVPPKRPFDTSCQGVLPTPSTPQNSILSSSPLCTLPSRYLLTQRKGQPPNSQPSSHPRRWGPRGPGNTSHCTAFKREISPSEQGREWVSLGPPVGQAPAQGPPRPGLSAPRVALLCTNVAHLTAFRSESHGALGDRPGNSSQDRETPQGRC